MPVISKEVPSFEIQVCDYPAKNSHIPEHVSIIGHNLWSHQT